MKRLFLLIFFSAVSFANLNSVDEKRYQTLIQEIRCPTCQNNNIADSNAPLAKQLRQQIATQIAAGRSDNEIHSYLHQRYGDFISYKPPLRLNTFLLWFLPAILMITALWWFLKTFSHTAEKGQSSQLKLSREEIIKKRPPLPFFLLFAVILSGVFFYWQQRRDSVRWQQLEEAWAAPLQELNENSTFNQPPFMLCQVLQRRGESLSLLGACYRAAMAHDFARAVYQRLMREEPHNPEYAYWYAEADLYSNPERPISAYTEEILKRINTLSAKLLLAAAYERANRSADALPLWQEIAPQIADNEKIGKFALERAQMRTVEIKISKKYPDGVRLFMSLKNAQGEITAVRALLPHSTKEYFKINDGDDLTLFIAKNVNSERLFEKKTILREIETKIEM